MSALSSRDVNAQPTSQPGGTDKMAAMAAGEENEAEQPQQQQKQLLKDIAVGNGYDTSDAYHIASLEWLPSRI